MKQLLQQLELSLLDSAVRQSVEQLNKLIADDFIEFGSSGKIYNKNDLLISLPLDQPKKFVAYDFEIRELDKDITLVTYKVECDFIISLRSSIWKQHNGNWQMAFHQGTIVL